MRELIGKLLAEVQRIKSEGDFESAKNLVENYGVKVDLQIHKEVKERYEKLNLAPYKGFVNPVYEVVYDNNNKIININVNYNEGFEEQMIRYSKEYSNLNVLN